MSWESPAPSPTCHLRWTTTLPPTWVAHHSHVTHHPYEAYIPPWEQIRAVDKAAELMALVTYILPPRTILTIPYGRCFSYILPTIKHNVAIKPECLFENCWLDSQVGMRLLHNAFWILPVARFNFGLALLHFRWHLLHDSNVNSSARRATGQQAFQLSVVRLCIICTASFLCWLYGTVRHWWHAAKYF